MSDKKVVKKVQKKVEKPKEVSRVSTSSYSTRPKIKRNYDAPSWSFGWQGPSKDEFKNNSSCNFGVIQSCDITMRAAS